MLIDCSYFCNGPRKIQNATLGNTPNPNRGEVNSAIMGYVCYYQERFLSDMLGDSLGNKIHTYLICQDEGGKPTIGEFDEICVQLKESFADYIFYNIIRDSSSSATFTGFVRLKGANEHISPARRQVSTWNMMVQRNRRFEQWARDNGRNAITVSKSMLTKINILNI